MSHNYIQLWTAHRSAPRDRLIHTEPLAIFILLSTTETALQLSKGL